MTKGTYILSACLVVSLIACAVFIYLWIDRSISLSYLDQSYTATNRSMNRLERLLEADWRGLPEEQVLQRLQKATTSLPVPQPIVKKEDGMIWFDEVRFNFTQGRLASIGDVKVKDK